MDIKRIMFPAFVSVWCLKVFSGPEAGVTPGLTNAFPYEQTIGNTRMALVEISAVHALIPLEVPSPQGTTDDPKTWPRDSWYLEITILNADLGATNWAGADSMEEPKVYLLDKHGKESSSPLESSGGFSSTSGLSDARVPFLLAGPARQIPYPHAWVVHREYMQLPQHKPYPPGSKAAIVIAAGFAHPAGSFRFTDISLPDIP